MNMQTVESSQIHAIGYDEPTKTLRIQFKAKAKPGSVYDYANVPPELFAEFLAAESKGKFFGARVKRETVRYPFTKIVPAPVAGGQEEGR